MKHVVALSRGAVVISIDVELLWGIWNKPLKKAQFNDCKLERDILKSLLDLFRKYNIRATWAVVGRLMDAKRDFKGLEGPFELWFAADMIDSIRNDPMAHEIGSHSYGHIYFHGISREQILEDLRCAENVHLRYGLPFSSFVFPRNQVGHLDVLKEVGLRVFRSTDAGLLNWTAQRAAYLCPAVNVIEKALALPSPVVWPIRHENGLIELPSSMLLMSRVGVRKLIHPRALKRKICEGILCAAKKRGIFHLWFHPSNFYVDMETQLNILESGLSVASGLREKDQLDVCTMGDFKNA